MSEATKKPRSKFAQEAQAASEAAGVAQQTQIMALTTTADLPDKLVRRNMPPMVKPGDVPVGATISGVIVAILDSPVSTIKGKLLSLRHESGQEYTFPCTGVIRQALAAGKKEGKELDEALEKEVGKMFYAKRTPDKTTTKYSGKGEAPKRVFMFDVFTSNK